MTPLVKPVHTARAERATEERMLFRTRSLVYSLDVCMVSAPIWAQTTVEKSLTVQQHRMKQCNEQAVGKTGDQRKAYMSQCLRGEAPAKALIPQQ
jgi:psiF repeat